MPLTKASFAVINVAGTITSTTVGNTTSIPSITFDQNGVISTVSNVTVSISNTQSQIASNPIFSGNTTTNGTGFTQLASGTTIQRPVTAANGQARYNTTLNQLEVYQNGVWLQYVVGYQVEYVVVAGGGAGSNYGGGGAGGYISSSAIASPLTAYTVTIGAGGSGGTTGSNGVNSSVFSQTAIGGGRGGVSAGAAEELNGASGGSGGGASWGGNGTGGAGTAGQGNAGGTGGAGDPVYSSPGGGGAGAVGQAGQAQIGGAGGVGLDWQSLGTFYAGGGGGGHFGGSGGSAAGGTGGGGNGGKNGTGMTAGTANRGGGGGGYGESSNSGANGGSGIVIIRYIGSQRGTGGTVTSAGGYTYHTFTSSSTFTG